MVGIFVGTDNKDETWAAAIDPSGSVLDHLQIPYGRDARAKKLKVCEGAADRNLCREKVQSFNSRCHLTSVYFLCGET